MRDDWSRRNGPPPPAGVIDAHLDDEALIGPSSPERDKHLADCSFCAGRLQRAHPAAAAAADDVSDEDAFNAAIEAAIGAASPAGGGTWLTTVGLGAAGGTRLPAAVAAAVSTPAATPDVAAAQLWRLRWEGEAILAAVVTADSTVSGTALMAPVTADVDLADAHTLVVEGTGNGLDGPWAWWLSLARPVPLTVFDRYYATLNTGVQGSLTHATATPSVATWAVDIVAAYRTEVALPDDAPVGTTPPTDVSTVALYDALREQFALFADAEPPSDLTSGAGAGSDVQAGTDIDTGADDVSDAASQRLTGEQVLEAIRGSSRERLDSVGLDRNALLPVIRGERALTPDQARALASLTGHSVAQFGEHEAALPPEFLAEAYRVVWRTARERWAHANGISVAEAPVRLARRAYALAGRTDRDGTESVARSKVRMVLHSYLTPTTTATSADLPTEQER